MRLYIDDVEQQNSTITGNYGSLNWNYNDPWLYQVGSGLEGKIDEISLIQALQKQVLIKLQFLL